MFSVNSKSETKEKLNLMYPMQGKYTTFGLRRHFKQDKSPTYNVLCFHKLV